MAKKREIARFISCACGNGYFAGRNYKRMSPNFRSKTVALKTLEILRTLGFKLGKTLTKQVYSSPLSEAASLQDVLCVWQIASDNQKPTWATVCEVIGAETAVRILERSSANKTLEEFFDSVQAIVLSINTNCH